MINVAINYYLDIAITKLVVNAASLALHFFRSFVWQQLNKKQY